jgi:rare lipoprotein A (peptidoglycan hydrolase)
MDRTRLDTTKSFLLACVAGAALAPAALPAAAEADTSGGQAAPSAGGTAADPSGLVMPVGVVAREVVPISGTLSGASGVPVVIERLDSVQGTWATIATATTAADGSFTAAWRADHIGRHALRARPAGSDPAAASTLTGQLTVYRPATATWFGPGFYGQRTACGETMTPTLLGVAHRWLPCGTLVDISYNGRSLRVPVVDRGPYSRGVSWDLTTATAQALGFDQQARIGALQVHDAGSPRPTLTARSSHRAASHSTRRYSRLRRASH